jgi:methyl-accepting chemotaxis protein
LDELKGKHHSVVYPQDARDSTGAGRLWQNLTGGKAQHGQFLATHKDGSAVWLEGSYIPLLENRKVISIIKIANDVTQSHRKTIANDALISAIHRSSAVIDFTPDGTIITANQNFLTTLGYKDVKEIAGKHHRIFCTPDFYQENPHFWKQLASGNIEQGLFQRISSSGQTVWIEATYSPVFDQSGKLIKITKIANDVTARIEK